MLKSMMGIRINKFMLMIKSYFLVITQNTIQNLHIIRKINSDLREEVYVHFRTLKGQCHMIFFAFFYFMNRNHLGP